MGTKLLNKLCEFLRHPFRKKMKVGEGSVCLFCRVNRGLYSPRKTIVDKIYNKIFYK